MDDSINYVSLQDKQHGKIQPWRPKKVKTLILADSLHRLDQHKKANRVWWCTTEVEFLTNIETGEKRFHKASHCRERLCPMCQWRKSIKIFNLVSQVMDRVQERFKNLKPIFLTLTMRNCCGNELSDQLDAILGKGWVNLVEHYKIRKILVGWYRALEITYDGEKLISQKRYESRKKEYDGKGIKPGDLNPNYDTFHPHLHIIFLADKSYFTSKDYMKTVDWVQMWRSAAKLDYDPICYIRPIHKGRKRKAVAEVAKYTLKDIEYLQRDKDLTDRLVSTYGKALKGRRLYAFGGIMKEIAKDIECRQASEGALMDTDDDIRGDVAEVIMVYRWSMGLCDYVWVADKSKKPRVQKDGDEGQAE